MPTHIMITCDKFHRNTSTQYRDIASREIGVNGRTDGRMEGQTDNREHNAFAAYCWQSSLRTTNFPRHSIIAQSLNSCIALHYIRNILSALSYYKLQRHWDCEG